MVKKPAITETTFKIQLPAGCHGYTYTLYLEHECENVQNCNGIFVPGKEKKTHETKWFTHYQIKHHAWHVFTDTLIKY